MIKLAMLVVASMGFLLGCDNTAPELQKSDQVFMYTGSRYIVQRCNGCADEMTMHFEDPRTHQKFDSDTSGQNGAHRLNWLNIGLCYIHPLSEATHKQVSCG